MTDKNERYRTSQTMLRNEFPGTGEFEIPYIPKASFCEEDFNNLLLIGFDRTHKSDTAWYIFSYMITSLTAFGIILIN